MTEVKAPEGLLKVMLAYPAFCDVVVKGEGDGGVDRDVVTPLGGGAFLTV